MMNELVRLARLARLGMRKVGLIQIEWIERL